LEPGEENDSFECGTWRKSWVLNKVWNLEEELVLKVWNLEKNSFLMWNLEEELVLKSLEPGEELILNVEPGDNN